MHILGYHLIDTGWKHQDAHTFKKYILKYFVELRQLHFFDKKTCTFINSIKFKIICIALFTIQSLQSSFPGNYVSTIDLYIVET